MLSLVKRSISSGQNARVISTFESSDLAKSDDSAFSIESVIFRLFRRKGLLSSRKSFWRWR